MKRCYIKVASYCLLETVQKLYEQGAKNLGIGKEDDEWLVSFDRISEKEMSAIRKARDSADK